jgi:O-antigen/teichoic acid export membrane protein
MLLLGTGMIWEQLPFSIAAMLLGILAKIVLCRAFGLNGLAWATVLVGLAITTPSVLFLVKRCLWRDAT